MIIQDYENASYRASHGQPILVKNSPWELPTCCSAREAGAHCRQMAICYYVTPSGGLWGCEKHIGGYPLYLNQGVTLAELQIALPAMNLGMQQ